MAKLTFLLIIPDGVKNASNICMCYSAEWSKWISAKAYMWWPNVFEYV